MTTSATLLLNATTTGASTSVNAMSATGNTFQATGTVSASTGAATVKIQVSNDFANWLDLGTITLTLGTSATADGFASYAPWAYVRANVDTISGTNATVTVTMAA